MEPIFFEKLIVRLLFTSKDDRDKIYPYLNPDLFESFENQQVVKHFLKFKGQYDKFPTVKELEIFLEKKEVFDNLKDCMNIDTTEYSDDYIRDEIEEFFKKKMIWNDVNAIVDVLKDDSVDKMSNIPDKLRDSLSFCLIPQSVWTLKMNVRECIMHNMMLTRLSLLESKV